MAIVYVSIVSDRYLRLTRISLQNSLRVPVTMSIRLDASQLDSFQMNPNSQREQLLKIDRIGELEIDYTLPDGSTLTCSEYYVNDYPGRHLRSILREVKGRIECSLYTIMN